MTFVPLADRTNMSMHVDNTTRNAKDRITLPSYTATVTPRRIATVAAPRVAIVSSYVHKPYGATVLPETFYSPIVEPISSLDVSRESVSIVVKAPIRRIYRNGRPVPVFADAPNTSVDSASSE
jgi:hypothetical protein